MNAKVISSYKGFIESKVAEDGKFARTLREDEHEFYPVRINMYSSLPLVVTLKDKMSNLQLHLYTEDYYLSKTTTHHNPYDFIRVEKDQELEVEI